MDYEMDHLFDDVPLAAEKNILDDYKGNVYSASEAAKILGKNMSTITKYVKLGYLNGSFDGSEYRITEDAIREFQEKYSGLAKIRKSSTTREITSIDPESYYNLKEVQLILNRKYNSVSSYIRAGSLVAEKRGGLNYVKGQSLIDFINAPAGTQKRPARNRAKTTYPNPKYAKDHYDRISILVPKGYADQLREGANNLGIPLSTLFVQSACEYIGIEPPQKKYSTYGINQKTE